MQPAAGVKALPAALWLSLGVDAQQIVSGHAKERGDADEDVVRGIAKGCLIGADHALGHAQTQGELRLRPALRDAQRAQTLAEIYQFNTPHFF